MDVVQCAPQETHYCADVIYFTGNKEGDGAYGAANRLQTNKHILEFVKTEYVKCALGRRGPLNNFMRSHNCWITNLYNQRTAKLMSFVCLLTLACFSTKIIRIRACYL